MLLPFFFFNDTATTEIYTLSLHDALPIFPVRPIRSNQRIDHMHRLRLRKIVDLRLPRQTAEISLLTDRKSTRLNSSHANISYTDFCLNRKLTATSATHANVSVANTP